MEPLMKQTGLPRSAISIAGSTQVALSAFTAPLASLLINKMGTLKVSFIGSIMATVGLLSSSFASEIVGVFTGIKVIQFDSNIHITRTYQNRTMDKLKGRLINHG